MFADAGVGHGFIAVVHHGAALEIAFRAECFEIQGAVTQAAQFIVKPGIDGAAVEHVAVSGLFCFFERGDQIHRDQRVIQYLLHNGGVAVLGHALVGMIEVVIVVIESNGQAFENAGGQLGGAAAPLFLGIAFEERFVEFFAHKSQCLLFKVLWFLDAEIGFALNKSLCFFRRKGFAEELVDGQQVDGQREHPALGRSLNAVGVGHEARVGLQVGPHALVVGVKDMRAILVHHHAGIGVTLCVAIAGYMSTTIKYLHRNAGFRQLPRNNGSGKSCSDNGYFLQVIVPCIVIRMPFYDGQLLSTGVAVSSFLAVGAGLPFKRISYMMATAPTQG